MPLIKSKRTNIATFSLSKQLGCRLRLSSVMFLYYVAIDMQTGEARAAWCSRDSLLSTTRSNTFDIKGKFVTGGYFLCT